MSHTAILSGVVAELFQRECPPEVAIAAEQHGWRGDLWRRVEEMGLAVASVPERLGGAGGSAHDDFTILRAVGRHAVPLPIAETGFLAGGVLARVGLLVPDGPLAVAPVHSDKLQLDRAGDAWTVSGVARFVPWASQAHQIVVVTASPDAGSVVGLVPRTACDIGPGTSVAGEPRDQVRFQDAVMTSWGDTGADLVRELRLRGALARSVMMVGALESALELTIAHAAARKQFGKPISAFQAIKQHLAQMARDVSLARVVVEVATAAAGDRPSLPELEIAVAKTICGHAAAGVSARAHQVHGAIGVTRECALQLYTRRLWAWRDEFGTEQVWAAEIGRAAFDAGRALWPLVASVGTEVATECHRAPEGSR